MIKDLGYEITLWKNELNLLPEELLDVDVVVCNGLFLHNDISKFINLKMIQLTSAGLDRVPVNIIKEREIMLSNAKGVYSIPIAEWVILKVLEIYKNTRFFEENQRNLEWNKNRNLFELHGKTFGIIGTGNIGQEVAKRSKAFGCNVLGLNTRGSKVEYFDKCFSMDDLDIILSKSDVVVLTIPLTDKTKYLVNRGTLRLMKDNAILINVSRGGIVNEKDLFEHLQNNKLLGVALDVFNEEPLPIESPLWKHNKVLVTPHNSFVSDNISSRMFELIYENLKSFINNKPLINKVEIR